MSISPCVYETSLHVSASVVVCTHRVCFHKKLKLGATQAITSSWLLLRLLHNSGSPPLFSTTHKNKIVNLLCFCSLLIETSYLWCLHDVDVCVWSLIFQQSVLTLWFSLDPPCFIELPVLKLECLRSHQLPWNGIFKDDKLNVCIWACTCRDLCLCSRFWKYTVSSHMGERHDEA